jgi:hypothetical protein
MMMNPGMIHPMSGLPMGSPTMGGPASPVVGGPPPTPMMGNGMAPGMPNAPGGMQMQPGMSPAGNAGMAQQMSMANALRRG